MSVITIHRAHQYSLEELRLKIDLVIKDIENRFEFRSGWETDKQLFFRRKGATGCIDINEDNFQLTLKLSMMYRVMECEIKQVIESIIDQNFAKDLDM